MLYLEVLRELGHELIYKLHNFAGSFIAEINMAIQNEPHHEKTCLCHM